MNSIKFLESYPSLTDFSATNLPEGLLGQWRYDQVLDAAAETNRLGKGLGEMFDAAVSLADYVSVLDPSDIEGRKKLAGPRYGFLQSHYKPIMDQYFEQVKDHGLEINTMIYDHLSSEDRDVDETYDLVMEVFSQIRTHRLTELAKVQWYDFIKNGSLGQPPKRSSLQEALYRYIELGVEIYTLRQRALNVSGTNLRQYLENPTLAPVRSFFEGYLNEIDAGIALTQASMQSDGGRYWVLPSPIQFEKGNADTNADFILFDAIRGQIVGPQVKSSGQLQEDAIESNPETMLVSGQRHLRNRAVVIETDVVGNITKYQVYSFAGKIILNAYNNYLRGLRPATRQRLMSYPEYRWPINHALMYGDTNAVNNAVNLISGKIERNLGRMAGLEDDSADDIQADSAVELPSLSV